MLNNLAYLDTLYKRYLEDDQSVEPSWRYFFAGLDWAGQMPETAVTTKESPDLRIYTLIDAFRKYGHLLARFNPIATQLQTDVSELDLKRLGFQPEEAEALFPTGGFLEKEQAPLKEILDVLKKTYCGTVGIEYMDLGQPELEKWIQGRIEPLFPLHLSKEDRLWILQLLNKAELFETFLHTKYVGQKRFSLEGSETLIPILAALIETGGELDLQDVTLGMAHRGRLNVLANILHKSYSHIFNEFEAHYAPPAFEGTGDVKYHKGFIGAIKTRKGQSIEVTLVANPSHLEAVDPVVEGIVRAKQQLKKEKAERKQSLAVLIHGDASIAGQGVLYETLQLSRLTGYATGGTVHIVINNQIGFTTLPKDARSTRYCTQIALAFGAPVFHVNAEDPEGCVRVARLATEIRQTFGCDVFIDLYCYRKYGHNESDEPTFTQPLEYALIKSKRSIYTLYKEKLLADQLLDEKSALAWEEAFKDKLHTAQQQLSTAVPLSREIPKEDSFSHLHTSVDTSKLIALAETFCRVPDTLKVHPKVTQGQRARLDMIHAPLEEAHIDWGMAEHLAYASLLVEGIHMRLSGQDVRRGTFSHRHAIWVDQTKEQHYFPLSHLSPTQAPFDIFNSPLSEYGVLGFEFGYSIAYPRSLTIWEAQFGDFANGAQVVVDQFIASAEQKWGLSSNLTLFLPHGYEGQGPEHSSARIERFLQLAGHENMRIVQCTTPAQLFHLLRAQALCDKKKPLILFTPKSMLRYPACVSSLKDFSTGSFQEVLDDKECSPAPRRLFFCSGKVFYELRAEREKAKAQDIALLRVEQLFPLPRLQIENLLKKYSSATAFYWIQQEHSNMGAYEYVRPLLQELLGTKSTLGYIGRERSAAPATGSYALHKKQWEDILQRAFYESRN